MKTEAWWVCSKCREPVVRIGKGVTKKTMLEHRKECEGATYSMKQVEQRKR